MGRVALVLRQWLPALKQGCRFMIMNGAGAVSAYKDDNERTQPARQARQTRPRKMITSSSSFSRPEATFWLPKASNIIGAPIPSKASKRFCKLALPLLSNNLLLQFLILAPVDWPRYLWLGNCKGANGGGATARGVWGWKRSMAVAGRAEAEREEVRT